MARSISRSAYRAVLFGCSALAAAGAGAGAWAQAAPDQGNTLGEIVVTAQKREQSLQDVPISVTAVTQAALQANRITNVTDLGAVAPNLSVRSAAGGSGIPVFAMRGVVSFGSVPGQDKSISMYLDGVFIGSSYATSFELPDLERIEVLRGPQGTLFGRNSTGGAISIITRNPSGRFGVHQAVTYGNYNEVRSVTRVELPQWGPLSASVSYVHDQRDGDIKNLGAGQVWDRSGPRTLQGVQVSPKTLGAKNADTWFATVRFKPNDNFETVYKFDYAVNHGTPEGTGVVGVFPAGAGRNAALLNALLAGNPPLVFSGAERPKYVNNFWTSNNYQRVFGHNITTNIAINDHISLKNILAYRKSFNYSNDDISGAGGLFVTPQVVARMPQLASVLGAPFVISGSESQSTAKQWSDEVQLNYNSQPLTLTAGALYFHLDTVTGTPDGLLGPSITLTPVPGGRVPFGPRNLNFNYAKSAAAYVQAEVHVTRKLDIVGGYRITKDDKTGTNYVNGALFNFTYSKTKPSYMAGVNYRPAEGILVYGKYANGFVSGGAVGPIAFAPETVRSWEGGVKSDLLDRRLRLNLAVFEASYKHIQAVSGGVFINRPELGTLVIDQGGIKTKGVEGEFTLLPMRGLSFNGGFGYTDVRATSVNPIFGTLATYHPTLRPRWTTNIAAQYETEPLFRDARLVLRADASWRSTIRTFSQDVIPAPFRILTYSPASWIVNTRVAFKDIALARGHVEVALWAKNLNDNGAPVFPINFFFLGSTTYQSARTFGIDVIYDY